ncbi:choice-of-anchor W domain-containing protein [Halobaculum lipolyticum]|uniref:Choice-of-anchor W domain-containing protein n=1 Tax=Halobaculum lipolyticum TaxID=3032001 RepID=A0ABD5WB74_9EURY|nr:choice-of-anchor W domain-containing protein [Halobaculum sp. DT31]
MSNRPIITSRRNVLLGIGAVGVASAGAGLGTTAYFSDTESFSGNMLQAGEFDLRVRFDGQYNMPGQPLFGTASGIIDGVNSTANGQVVGEADFGFLVDDLKPGDTGIGEFCFQIDDNPGYLTVDGVVTDNSENGYTEPEPETAATGDINDEGDANGEGELLDALLVHVSYSNGNYSDGGLVEYLPGTAKGDVFSGTLREFFAGAPYLFDHDPSTPVADPVPGSDDGFLEPCLLFEFEVPTSVGNEIQTDSIGFDIVFNAVQARHNLLRASGANTGFVDASQSVNQNGGYGDGGEDFGSVAMTGRARYGGTNTWELATGAGAGTPGQDQQNIDWGPLNGQTVPFAYTYDADAATATFDLGSGASVSTATGVPAPAGRIGLQAKADEATVDIDNVALSADGTAVSFVGPDGVTASNDGPGREIAYVALTTGAADLADGFVVSGDVTITLQGDYAGGDEGVAFDVVVE